MRRQKSDDQWPRITQVIKSGKPRFLVDTRIGGTGRRTYLASLTEARLLAQQARAKREAEGSGAFDLSASDRIDAQRALALLRPLGIGIFDAVKAAMPHLQAQSKPITLANLADELLEAKSSDGRSKRYLSDLKSRLARFVSEMGAERSPSEITGPEIDGWLRGLETVPSVRHGEPRRVSPTTRNNFCRCIGVLYEFAVRQGYAAENPVRSAAGATVVESTVGVLTPEQTSALLHAASAEGLPGIAIAAFAGLRRAEIERLDWSEVNLSAGEIHVVASKAKSARRRIVPIEPNLAGWLAPYAGRSGRVAPAYRERLDEARSAAGIAQWPQNALRHSYASYWLAAHQDAAALALRLGHQSPGIIFQHYRAVVGESAGRAYFDIQPLAPENVVLMQAAS